MRKAKKKVKKDNKVKIELDLEMDTYKFLKRVSKLSTVSMEDVIAVILSMELVKEEMRKEAQNERA